MTATTSPPAGRVIAWLAGLWMLAHGVLVGAPAQSPLPPAPRSRAEVEAVLAKAPKDPLSTPVRPMTILLLADVKDHGKGAHDYPQWQENWARLLGGSAAWGRGPVNLHGDANLETVEKPGAPGVSVIKAQQWPSSEQFEAADVVVAFCYLKWDSGRLEQLGRYLARGKGFVAIHSATWTKPKPSADVAAVTGVGGFQYYRHGIIKLQIDTPDHPICVGLPREIELNDESYWPATPEPNLPGFTVLASSAEQIKPGANVVRPHVMFWTGQPGAGRVFGCVPGHFTWTFDDPYFRLLLLRGIAWAGGSSPYRFDAQAASR